MSAPSSPLRSRWRVVCCLFVITAGACTKWSAVMTPTPEKALASATTYRVTTVDGVERKLHAVFLRNDSLLGNRADGVIPAVIGFPVANVKTIAVRKVDGVATFMLLAAPTVFLGFLGANADYGAGF